MKQIDFMRDAFRVIGRGVRKLTAKVNPDVWRELGCVSLSAYSLVLPKTEKVADPGDDGHRPLVLVHGLGGNRGAWLPLRWYLRLLGRKRVFAFGYQQGTVENHARDLQCFVQEVMAATGEKKVDIVAHSLGGIITRYAMQRLDLGRCVHTFVTLATPHRGTYAAHYANTTLINPLRPESALLRDLNGGSLIDRVERFFTLYSNRDVYVVPNELMKHPEAENLFLPNISHSQYLVSPKVFRAVAACLN